MEKKKKTGEDHLLLCVCVFVQPLCVEVLVVQGSLGHGVLQGGDLLLRSAQMLLQPLLQAALFHPLSFLPLQQAQQLLVALTYIRSETEGNSREGFRFLKQERRFAAASGSSTHRF